MKPQPTLRDALRKALTPRDKARILQDARAKAGDLMKTLTTMPGPGGTIEILTPEQRRKSLEVAFADLHPGEVTQIEVWAKRFQKKRGWPAHKAMREALAMAISASVIRRLMEAAGIAPSRRAKREAHIRKSEQAIRVLDGYEAGRQALGASWLEVAADVTSGGLYSAGKYASKTSIGQHAAFKFFNPYEHMRFTVAGLAWVGEKVHDIIGAIICSDIIQGIGPAIIGGVLKYFGVNKKVANTIGGQAAKDACTTERAMADFWNSVGSETGHVKRVARNIDWSDYLFGVATWFGYEYKDPTKPDVIKVRAPNRNRNRNREWLDAMRRAREARARARRQAMLDDIERRKRLARIKTRERQQMLIIGGGALVFLGIIWIRRAG